jgi:hypothetical protein
VALGNCEWKVRLGRFLSPFGYEQVPAIENFFYSRTYMRYFTEPFTHTGLIGERSVSNNLTVLSGLTLGWNTAFDQNDNGFNYLGGIRYQVGPNANVALTSSLGDTGYRGSGTLSSAVVDLKLTEKVNYVFQGDVVNLQTNDEFGFTNYLFYCHNRCLGFGTRLEWWKTDQLFTSTRSTWDWTVGANIRPHANVVIRPEFRVDWGAAAVSPGDPIVGVDAIIAF